MSVKQILARFHDWREEGRSINRKQKKSPDFKIYSMSKINDIIDDTHSNC